MTGHLPNPTANPQAHGAVLADIQKRWNAAASTWDIKALVEIYSADAMFFGLLPQLFVGRSEIEDYFRSYQDVLDSVTLTLVEEHTRTLSQDVFAAQGFADVLNKRQDSTVALSKIRFSFVLTNASDTWQISLHHFSKVPQHDASEPA